MAENVGNGSLRLNAKPYISFLMRADEEFQLITKMKLVNWFLYELLAGISPSLRLANIPRLQFLLPGKVFGLLLAQTAYAGPPFFTDDPWTSGEGNHELFLFTETVETKEAFESSAGIDYAYSPKDELELSIVVPVSHENPDDGLSETGLTNIKLSSKFLVMEQAGDKPALAFAPSVGLPSASSNIGDDHASLTLPVWLGHASDNWTFFGGGGCTITNDDEKRNFCFAGLAWTALIVSSVELGVEVFHQAAEEYGGKSATGVGLGMTYGINSNTYLLVYGGTGIQNRSETNQASIYASLLITF